MATSIDYERLRRDIGVTSSELSDTEAQAIFDEAAEYYSDTASINAMARIILIRGLLADSAKMVTYQQNTSMEQLSDVYKHLSALLQTWESDLDRAVGQDKAVFKVW